MNECLTFGLPLKNRVNNNGKESNGLPFFLDQEFINKIKRQATD